jgi:hypothetical protein
MAPRMVALGLQVLSGLASHIQLLKDKLQVSFSRAKNISHHSTDKTTSSRPRTTIIVNEEENGSLVYERYWPDSDKSSVADGLSEDQNI